MLALALFPSIQDNLYPVDFLSFSENTLNATCKVGTLGPDKVKAEGKE
jgi:hypothetical protein